MMPAPSLFKVIERVDQGDLRVQVYSGHRFVENEQLWVAHDRARDKDPLLLAARERTNVAPCEIRNTKLFERDRNTASGIVW